MMIWKFSSFRNWWNFEKSLLIQILNFTQSLVLVRASKFLCFSSLHCIISETSLKSTSGGTKNSPKFTIKFEVSKPLTTSNDEKSVIRWLTLYINCKTSKTITKTPASRDCRKHPFSFRFQLCSMFERTISSLSLSNNSFAKKKYIYQIVMIRNRNKVFFFLIFLELHTWKFSKDGLSVWNR